MDKPLDQKHTPYFTHYYFTQFLFQGYGNMGICGDNMAMKVFVDKMTIKTHFLFMTRLLDGDMHRLNQRDENNAYEKKLLEQQLANAQ
mgnify:CR=1 FL=1